MFDNTQRHLFHFSLRFPLHRDAGEMRTLIEAGHGQIVGAVDLLGYDPSALARAPLASPGGPTASAAVRFHLISRVSPRQAQWSPVVASISRGHPPIGKWLGAFHRRGGALLGFSALSNPPSFSGLSRIDIDARP